MFFRFLVLMTATFCSFVQAEESSSNPNTHRVFQFENDPVRVWKTVITPDQPLKMHRHDCRRVIVELLRCRQHNSSYVA